MFWISYASGESRIENKMTSVKQIAYGMKTLYVERYDRGCILTAEGIPVNDYTREVYRVISIAHIAFF